MARPVKCLICGIKGDSDIFLKIRKEEEGNRYFYFCEKEHRDEWIEKRKETEKYNVMMTYVAKDLYGYEEGMIFPTSLTRRIKELRKFYSYDVIHETFKLCSDSVKWAIQTKSFAKEYNKTAYIMTIVESNINDVYLKRKSREKQREKAEKLEVDDSEIAVMQDVFLRENSTKSSSNGISWLLEDDEI